MIFEFAPQVPGGRGCFGRGPIHDPLRSLGGGEFWGRSDPRSMEYLVPSIFRNWFKCHLSTRQILLCMSCIQKYPWGVDSLCSNCSFWSCCIAQFAHSSPNFPPDEVSLTVLKNLFFISYSYGNNCHRTQNICLPWTDPIGTLGPYHVLWPPNGPKLTQTTTALKGVIGASW